MSDMLTAFLPGDSHAAHAACGECIDSVLTPLDTLVTASDAVLSDTPATCCVCGKHGKFMSVRDEMILKWGWDTVNRIDSDAIDWS